MIDASEFDGIYKNINAKILNEDFIQVCGNILSRNIIDMVTDPTGIAGDPDYTEFKIYLNNGKKIYFERYCEKNGDLNKELINTYNLLVKFIKNEKE